MLGVVRVVIQFLVGIPLGYKFYLLSLFVDSPVAIFKPPLAVYFTIQ